MTGEREGTETPQRSLARQLLWSLTPILGVVGGVELAVTGALNNVSDAIVAGTILAIVALIVWWVPADLILSKWR